MWCVYTYIFNIFPTRDCFLLIIVLCHDYYTCVLLYTKLTKKKKRFPKLFYNQKFQGKIICIIISNDSPVITWYWIDTQIPNIAHPKLTYWRKLEHKENQDNHTTKGLKILFFQSKCCYSFLYYWLPYFCKSKSFGAAWCSGQHSHLRARRPWL